jgi:hypothetical protein
MQVSENSTIHSWPLQMSLSLTLPSSTLMVRVAASRCRDMAALSAREDVILFWSTLRAACSTGQWCMCKTHMCGAHGSKHKERACML